MRHQFSRPGTWICAGALALAAHAALTADAGAARDVYVRFDIDRPDGALFPSDLFTVPDARHNTGLRVHLPYPNCAVRPSDCDDLDVVNTLDGWGLQTRVSVPFSGPIDPTSVTSDSVFLVSLESTRPQGPPGGSRIGTNQVVWDTATHTLHFEVDRLLDQHRRYAVIVTTDVRDVHGQRVKKTAAFESYVSGASGPYAARLREGIEAAHALGVPPGHVVAASVFTTQTITSVMERIRDDIKAATPAPADFSLGPEGTRSVFTRSSVSSIVFRQHTGAAPINIPVNMGHLDAVPGTVGTLAYGRYLSPSYLAPGEFIPAVGTLADTPPMQGEATIYFTLYLPSGVPPSGGWPVVISGGGATSNQHVSPTFFAATAASHGLASIGISHVGQGLGPLGRLLITRTDGTVVDLPNPGRGVDQNGDGIYALLEGSEAAAPRTWTVSLRDTNRQTVVDLMQLVRVIDVGMDVDGDGRRDIDPSRIYFQGVSVSTMLGASFVALDPAISAAAFVVAPGLIPEHVRWQPVRRSAMGAALQARVPSLINAPGITSIDGVAVAGPHFNENKPLRDLPTVVNTIAGAMEIQKVLELAEMAAEAGASPVPWARYLQTSPLAGGHAKSILVVMAKGDQNAVNPGTSAIVREGGLESRTSLFRNDLAVAFDPAVAKNPHLFAGQPTSPNATVRAIARGVHEQLAVFFKTFGASIIHPTPAQFFEVPLVGPLPETLDFIP